MFSGVKCDDVKRVLPELCKLVAEFLYAEVLRVAVLSDLDHLMSQCAEHCRTRSRHCQRRHDAQQNVQYTLHHRFTDSLIN